MGLFSSDGDKNRAARKRKQQEKAIKKGRKKAREENQKSVAAQEAAKTEARADLTTGRDAAIPELRAANERARGDLTAGKQEGLGYLQGASDRLGSAYGAARGYYQPLYDAALGDFNRYRNFYGGGGAEGSAAAQAEWQASPLYRAMVGEGSLGTQALNRQAAARGNPYNATDLLAYDDALAGRYLGDYTSGLWNTAGMAPDLAGALAGLYGEEARMQAQLAAQQSEVATGTAGRLSGNEMQTGTNVANAQMGTGQQLAGTSQHAADQIGGYGQNQANREMNFGTQQAGVLGDYYDAQQAISNAENQNMWNAINLAAKPLTAFAGNPSAFA